MRDILFVSHANPEDNEFSQWLSLQLAREGYPVWCDLTKLLGGEDFWVVRKGATPAFPGQQGFVGGSMGDDAVILEGVESSLSRAAYYSTVHGAGRVMSRTAARGRVDRRTAEILRPGAISREMMR